MADLTELIDTAAGDRYVSTTDLKSAYHQIIKWRKKASTSQVFVVFEDIGCGTKCASV